MAPVERLYVAYVAEPAPEGRRGPHAPAHLTLVPPFTAPVDVAADAMRTAAARSRPFTVHAAEPARFGPRGDIPVYLVEPVGELASLHERLVGELARRGVGLLSDRHVHDRFVPHIRIRPSVSGSPVIGSGQEFTIDHVALMRSGAGRVVAREALVG